MEMQFLNQNKKSRTFEVLHKWGVEGEINQFNIRNAASSFARIQVKNKIMKYVTIGSICFLLVFLGLMIASTIIGTEITKDLNVKDGVLVKGKGSHRSPLKTSTAFFSADLRITMPLCTVQSIKKLKFAKKQINGKEGIIEFDVVSFYYSKGRRISFYGHNFMATVKSDNTVDLIPLKEVNGMRRYDLSQRDNYSGSSTSSTTDTEEIRSEEATPISDCDDFNTLNEKGNYTITQELNCTFPSPLPAFGGELNGASFNFTIKMHNQGSVGLFQKLNAGARIKNLLIYGDFDGLKYCGMLAVEIDAGVVIKSSSVHGTLKCGQDSSDSSDEGFIFAGGFASYLDNPLNISSPVYFQYDISQTKMNVVTQDPSTSLQGGFYGISFNTKTRYNNTVAATYFENYGEEYKNYLFGFKASSENSTTRTLQKKNTPSKKIVWSNTLINGIFPDNCEDIWIEGNVTQVNRFIGLCYNYYNVCHMNHQTCCSDTDIDSAHQCFLNNCQNNVNVQVNNNCALYGCRLGGTKRDGDLHESRAKKTVICARDDNSVVNRKIYSFDEVPYIVPVDDNQDIQVPVIL